MTLIGWAIGLTCLAIIAAVWRYSDEMANGNIERKEQ